MFKRTNKKLTNLLPDHGRDTLSLLPPEWKAHVFLDNSVVFTNKADSIKVWCDRFNLWQVAIRCDDRHWDYAGVFDNAAAAAVAGELKLGEHHAN